MSVVAPNLGVSGFALVSAIGLLSGFACSWFMRRTTKAEQIRSAMNAGVAALFEFRLFNDEPAVILRAQVRLIESNARLLRSLALPSLIVILPCWGLLVTTERIVGRVALKPGESIVVTVQYRNGHDVSSDLTLTAPPGFTIETPGVRVSEDHQVSWRVRATKPVSGNLEIHAKGNTLTKTISAVPGLQVLSEVRAGTLRSFLTDPLELPFSDDNIASISLQYPSATILNVHWLIWFSVASLAGVVLNLTQVKS